MPNNRISFGGQKRRASENRPNRKQDEIESKEYRHEKQRIRATVLCAILTNKRKVIPEPACKEIYAASDFPNDPEI